MTATTVAGALLAALRSVPGLRPATPLATTLVPWDLDLLAVDVTDRVVELRLVAFALPLPPLLQQAETVLRQALSTTGQPAAVLRLVITDIDASAFDVDRTTGGNSHDQLDQDQ